jgi:lipoate---protein ligase
MFVVRPDEPTLVLGSASVPIDLLDANDRSDVALRRRRGGGGSSRAPGDLWIDWWIPAATRDGRRDVRVSSRGSGGGGRRLREQVGGDVRCTTDPLRETRHRVVCFAGRGPGEVFVDGRKAVGLAQWRVREGIL